MKFESDQKTIKKSPNTSGKRHGKLNRERVLKKFQRFASKVSAAASGTYLFKVMILCLGRLKLNGVYLAK